MIKPNPNLNLSEGESQQTPKNQKPTLKRNLKKKKFWTETEDRVLQKAVQKYGPKRWSKISKLLKNRHPKRCRERWFNYLCQTKQEWKTGDLWLLYLAYRNYGNKWSKISKILGRGDNIVKNKVTCFKRNGMEKFQQKLNDLKNDVKMLQALPQIQRKFVRNLIEGQILVQNRARVQKQAQKAQQNHEIMENEIRTRYSQEQNPYSVYQYGKNIEIFQCVPPYFQCVPPYSQLFIRYYMVWNGYGN